MSVIITNGEIGSDYVLNSTTMYVRPGGVAERTSLYNYASMEISGGTATSTVVNHSSCFVDVLSGGTAECTTINSFGSMRVFHGFASKTTVNTGGYFVVSNGGIASETFVSGYSYLSTTYNTYNLTAYMYVGSGGVANDITMGSGGKLVVSSGGTATNVFWTPFEGNVVFADGAKVTFDNRVSGIYYGVDNRLRSPTILSNYSGSLISHAMLMPSLELNFDHGAYVMSGGTADDAKVQSGGKLFVYSGGTAINTMDHPSGEIQVYFGGVASNTVLSGKINSSTLLYVSSGGVASNTTVNSHGIFRVSVDGKAVSTLIKGGSMVISSNGSAGTVDVSSGGSIVISSGGTATGIREYGGFVDCLESSTATFAPNSFSGVNLSGEMSATVHSGTTAYMTTLKDNTEMIVFSGGVASNTTVNSHGVFHVSSGGAASNLTLNSKGDLRVSSGGTAMEIVENGGYAVCEEGAEVTFVPNSFDGINGEYVSVTVHSGTTANNFKISAGSIDIFSGGTAIGGELWGFSIRRNRYYGNMVVGSGGVVNDATAASNGRVYVESGATATSVTAGLDGRVVISYGGTATEIIENGGVVVFDAAENVSFASHSFSGVLSGSATIHSGTTALGLEIRYESSLTYPDIGCLLVYSGGRSYDTIIQHGSITVYSGGLASGTLVCSNPPPRSGTYRISHSSAFLYISSGGIANDTRIDSCGNMYVSSGGMASNVTANSSGRFEVESGGLFTGRLTIESGAVVSAHEGSILDFDISMLAPGSAALINDYSLVWGAPTCTVTISLGQANGVYTLAENAAGFDIGSITVAQDASGESVGTLVSEGVFAVGNGTMTLNIDDDNALTLTVSGFFDTVAPVLSGVLFSETEETYRPVVLTVDFTDDVGVASTLYRLEDDDEWTEYEDVVVMTENGKVFFKAVDEAGNESEIVGYTVSNIIPQPDDLTSGGAVFPECSVDIQPDEVYSNTVVFGDLYVCSGGTALNTAVSSGGSLLIESGGFASGVSVAKGATVYVNEGGMAYDVAWTPFEGSFSCEYGASVTFADVCSGVYYGLNASEEEEEKGCLYSSAMVMENMTIDGGEIMYVMNEGTANTIEVDAAGVLKVFSGGTVSSATVCGGAERRGAFIVYSGGHAENIRNYGFIYVWSGGMADDITVDCSTLTICGTANGVTLLNMGEIYVESGGVVNSVSARGDCEFDEMGSVCVSSGGTINGVLADSGSMIEISSGGKMTGPVTIRESAFVSACEGGIVDFDLSGLAPGSAALVNDLSLILGAPLYTLTVSGSQANGTYRLAYGAYGFDTTISVASGNKHGTISVGETVTIGKYDYTLSENSGTLLVTIADAPQQKPETLFFPGCFAGGRQAILAVQTEDTETETASVTIYVEGETWGSTLGLDPGWEIAGVGDFNGDGRDDFLRVNEEGYVVGEMTRVNGKFNTQVMNFLNEGWDILGTGDFNGNGTDDVLIANPTGASETVGLLGYWESGETWTLINGYSPEWECVSTGDYNGDGKCDMLWRNSFEGDGGLIYNAYCTWIVDNPVDWRMVSVANPDEWNFLCSGDFDGDKMNDIAMINNVGVVGIWGIEDGYLNSWSILSAVTPEWTLAGVADFDGDGTDDIAWCNSETGLVGCWQIKNKELASWQTIAALQSV